MDFIPDDESKIFLRNVGNSVPQPEHMNVYKIAVNLSEIRSDLTLQYLVCDPLDSPQASVP
jgi:hypothetical protein